MTTQLEGIAARDPEGGEIIVVNSTDNGDGTRSYKKDPKKSKKVAPNPKGKGKDGKVRDKWKKWYFMDRIGKHYLEFSNRHGRDDAQDYDPLCDDGSLATIVKEALKRKEEGGDPAPDPTPGKYHRISVNMCNLARPLKNPKDKEKRKKNSGTWLADLDVGPVFGYDVFVCFSAKGGHPPVKGNPRTGRPIVQDGKTVPAVPVSIPPNPGGK